MKPAALQLEDPRSKESSKNNNQTTAMFIDIGYQAIFNLSFIEMSIKLAKV